MNVFVLVAVTHFLALLSPGPDFLLIVRTSLQQHRWISLILCFGIAFGNAIYIGIVFLSLNLFSVYPILLNLIQLIGSCYFIYLSYLLFQSSRTKRSLDEFESSLSNNKISLYLYLKYFFMGLASSVLNPKNILFYTSIITLLGTNISFQNKLFYAIWMTMVVWIWDSTIALLFHQQNIRSYFNQYIQFIEKITAIVFAIFALFLLIKILF